VANQFLFSCHHHDPDAYTFLVTIHLCISTSFKVRDKAGPGIFPSPSPCRDLPPLRCPPVEPRPLFTLEQVTTFLDNQGTSLCLNRSKCRETTLDTIKGEGLSILGSRLGSTDSQAAFLEAKVDSLLDQAKILASLPHQHALLLLRQCLQQDLRHLQRSSASDSKNKAAWSRLDQGLLNEVRRLRGRVSDRQARSVSKVGN